MRKPVQLDNILKGYKPPEGLSVPWIIADLCNYCGERTPKQPIPWKWVAKICNNRAKMPLEDGDEVQSMKSRLTRARQIARREFGRDIISLPGFGIRITTNDEDIGRTSVVKGARRLIGASKNFSEVVGMTDAEKISDKALREYVQNADKAGKLISRAVPLLEPPKEDEESE